MFSLKGKTAVVLGGGGILGCSMANGLKVAGANVAVCDLKNGDYLCDAMSKAELAVCRDQILADYGRVDILVNAVGGNMKDAATTDERSFFDMSAEAIERVVGLNLMGGAVLPSQVFGDQMVRNEHGGVIVNISSMNAFRPLTRIPGYSAAKAAVSNFTQWLAVDIARNFGAKVRVNAIAPGFFLTDQNRFLLTDEQTGALTARGQSIIDHTPMGRFGQPDDLIGALVWLCSDASKFVTGVVVPVDGGFSAYAGV
jgi:NAD(P)-dependent dehydrogenase (short-subunit alcohol dehydrogenase family)